MLRVPLKMSFSYLRQFKGNRASEGKKKITFLVHHSFLAKGKGNVAIRGPPTCSNVGKLCLISPEITEIKAVCIASAQNHWPI